MRIRTIGILAILAAASATAQQTGRIEGTVVDGGTPAPDVEILAASAVMPRPRTARTDANGWFTLAELVPGTYQVVLDVPGRGRRAIGADVFLDQATVLAIDLDAWGEADRSAIEEIVVTAERISSRRGAAIANALDDGVVDGVPLGLDYRDLVKLAPGVQYTQDAVRGPEEAPGVDDAVDAAAVLLRAAAARTTSTASTAWTCRCRCSARCPRNPRLTTSTR